MAATGSQLCVSAPSGGKTAEMSSILVIMLRKDPQYQLLGKCRDIVLRTREKAFRLSDLLMLDSFSWSEKRMLKELFGGEYSEVVSKGLHFINQNGTWKLDAGARDVKHTYALKILNHLHGHNEFTVGSLVRTVDVALIRVLLSEWSQLFEREVGEPGYEITEAMLAFIAAGLTQRFGGEHRLDYEFIEAFLESFYDYDDVLVEQFFENENLQSGGNDEG